MTIGNNQQDELPLSSIASHRIFPGRTSLYVAEVARALTMTDQQVIDLIEENELHGINIASGLRCETNPKGNKTPRKFWRIPVSAYDEFIARRRNR